MPPTPAPLVHPNAVAGNIQPENRGGSISLGLLIDFIVQRTYHELTVLAELLPRKTDMERKIEIYNFATGTRQLFVRLLALVKWASSASKVDKSAHIMGFLDKQSMLFVETADMLSKMSRETLVHARLPNFHIPAAVEVLTTGSYSRLPLCIRDRIVPPNVITPAEKRQTLQHLNQVIQHRLVTSNLPPQMRNLKVENGRVTFHVENEFEVSLTMMGDTNKIPWRLLDIEILVQDKETGDGKALVHSMQIQYVHQLVQSRLIENTYPLKELYNCLHFFCQSLQLEVLYSQTLRLCRDRLGDYIVIDEYTPGKCLTISYWRELTSRDPRSELGYRLTVQTDQHSPWKPLQIVHTPSLSKTDSETAGKAIRSEQLSLERLLVHTIYMRTKSRLRELKQELERRMDGDIECVLQGSPAVLSVPILQPCLRAEQLLITVDTHTGILLASVPQYDAPLVQEIQQTLNGDQTKFEALVSELRYWITRRRCEKTLRHLPATPFERMPLLYAPDHPITKIGKHRTFIRLHKYPNSIVVVEFKEKLGSPCEMDYRFHLVGTKPTSVREEPKGDNVTEPSLSKAYLKITSLIQLDSFVCTHGPFTRVDSENLVDRIVGKRKGSGKGEPATKRHKHPAYFLAEVAHVVALCDERIPFATLAHELMKKKIAHGGLQVEANGASLLLPLLHFPPVDGVDRETCAALEKALLSASVRIQSKGTRIWVAQLVFCRSPLVSTHPKEQGLCRPVYFQYDVTTLENMSKTVDAILNDWAQIAHLYAIVLHLAENFKSEKVNLSSIVTVKSYTFNRLILGYGPNRGASVTVQWSTVEKKFKLSFGGPGVSNPHIMVKLQLQMFLNQTLNLTELAVMLHETYQPLISLGKLSTTPQLGVLHNRPGVPVQTFVILPQSPSHVRVTYHNLYCLDIHLSTTDGLVSVRDGAYSIFDKSSVVEEFTPTQGLKAFLSQYVDDTAVFRRRSQSEDDNPPSPVTMETDIPMRSDSAPVRFHPPHTPGGGSNPHTPASPHTGNLSQAGQGFGSSPVASFNIPSPTPAINPSPSAMLPLHPSPGPGMIASSPSNPLHAPSPGLMPTPSPNPSLTVGHSPAFMSQAHGESSPFPSSQSMASPAPSPWPASPSVPRPSPRAGQSPMAIHSPLVDNQRGGSLHSHQLSRVLPQRSWAGAIPTHLTREAFDTLCTPSPLPAQVSMHPGSADPVPLPTSPLERFLGCVYLKRQLQRVVQSEENFAIIPNAEPGMIHFKTEIMHCKVCIHPQHLQSLHLKLIPCPEYKDQWSAEEILTLEKFFDSRVVVPPYRSNNLLAFGRMLNTSVRVLKDFLRIMKLEMNPGMFSQQYHWSVQWCLRSPPSAQMIIPTGMASVLIIRHKILFYLLLSQHGSAPGTEPLSIVLPIIYDQQTNMIQLAEKKEHMMGGVQMNLGLFGTVNQMLKRFSEYSAHLPDCIIWPAIQEVLANLPSPVMGNSNGPDGMNNQQAGLQQGMPMGQMQQMTMGGGGPGMNPGNASMQSGMMQAPPPPMHPQMQMQGQYPGPPTPQVPGGPGSVSSVNPQGPGMGMGQHGMM